MVGNVIVTGANRGIGRSIVQAFAESGYNIWACARTQDDVFEQDMSILQRKTNVWIRPVYFDLADEAAVQKGIGQIISEKKEIDVLINNAGVASIGLALMTPLEEVKKVYGVNVFAQIQISQLVARRMMRQKSGCIINMCSVGGIEAMPGYLAYGSSKAALIWITKLLARELGGYGIRVNGIAPGLIDTQMGYCKTEDERKKVFDRMSIRRMGRPEEVAKAALYVASEDAAFMTGQILVLDGGRC